MEIIDKVCVAYKLVEECQFRQFVDIVECGLDANTIIQDKGISLLHLAVGIEPIDVSNEFTKVLLHNGADPNIRSEDFMTPLHVAAAWGRTDAIKLLVSYGGDISLIDYERKMAIDYACDEQHWDIVEFLLQITRENYILELNDDSPTFNLELDKVILKNGDIVAEYNGDNLIPQIGTKNYCSIFTEPQIGYVNEKFSRRTNSVNVNVTSRKNRHHDSSLFKKICHKFNYDSSKQTTDTSNSSDSTSHSSESTTHNGISIIEFSPTEENVKYSCFYKSNESTSKNKLYPDLSELMEEALDLNQTCKVLEPESELSEPEITEDRSEDDLNACLISGSQSNLSFRTARSSVVESSLNQFIADQNVFEETRASVEEEYKYTDEDEGIILIERRLLVTPVLLSSDNSASSDRTHLSVNSVASSVPQVMNYDNHTLRRELTDYGIDVGPITDTTKRLYLKKLYKLKKNPNLQRRRDELAVAKKKSYSVELEKTFRHPNWCNDLTLYADLEFKVSLQFAQPDGKRKWREGNIKSSFTYLLLDPRVTDNLPCRTNALSKPDIWKTFIDSIFYIGKGKRSRPYNHLYQAVAFWDKNLRSNSDQKINHILDIWGGGVGVVCLHVFQNVIPVEAYTREAAMIDVLGLANLKNTQSGSYYGVAASWPMKERRKLGLYLLYRAMLIFLNEGERQLNPGDIGK